MSIKGGAREETAKVDRTFTRKDFMKKNWK